MAIVGIACLTLLVVTTVLHYEVLRLLNAGLPALRIPSRGKLLVVIFTAFVAHAVEVLLYGIAFYLLAGTFAAGTLGDPADLTLLRCIYFSGETYTTLGYGDIIPQGPLRLLADAEALNGLLLIGWSASYTYVAMERFWSDAGGRATEPRPSP